VKNIQLYIEGGGDSREQHIRCREGFSKLLEKAGYSGRMPRIHAGGGREKTFDLLKTAIRCAGQNDYPILLVDSEDVISNSSLTAWTHLKARDNWDRPNGVADDQAQLMATCMETWIMADRVALRSFFGDLFNENALFSTIELETRHRHDVQDGLERATRSCKKKQYQKGTRSFELVAELHPETLRELLPHFQIFLDTLDRHLKAER
jgi:hypothetical protein